MYVWATRRICSRVSASSSSNMLPGSTTMRVSGFTSAVTTGNRFTSAAPVVPSANEPITAAGTSAVTVTPIWSSVGSVTSGASIVSATSFPPASPSLSEHDVMLRPSAIGRANIQNFKLVFFIAVDFY